jgi:hypothetical protein
MENTGLYENNPCFLFLLPVCLDPCVHAIAYTLFMKRDLFAIFGGEGAGIEYFDPFCH